VVSKNQEPFDTHLDEYEAEEQNRAKSLVPSTCQLGDLFCYGQRATTQIDTTEIERLDGDALNGWMVSTLLRGTKTTLLDAVLTRSHPLVNGREE